MPGINPKVSVLGLYNWDDTIFDGLMLPAGLDHDYIVKNLMLELADLSVIYTDPEFMKEAIRLWSFTKQDQWKRLYNALQEDYNPLWNKDANYSEKETRDLHGEGKSENVSKVSAYNSEDFVNSSKGNSTGESSDTGTITRERREYGNIGVTSSQDLLDQEVKLWSHLNMAHIIINDFKNRFCIMVY